MPSEYLPRPISYGFLSRAGLLRAALQERCDHLAVLCMWQADDYGAVDGRMLDKTLLNLEGIDVLSATDDDVLEASGDGAVALCIKYGFVARVQPHYALLVPDHSLGSLAGVLVVAALELISRDAEFAPCADRDDAPIAVDNLAVRMRE